MLVYRIDFDIVVTNGEELQTERIFSLFASLLHDGRICPDQTVLKRNGRYSAFVTTLSEDAFTGFDGNPYIPEDIKKLAEVGLAPPVFEFLGQAAGSPEACQCHDPSGYVLYTNYLAYVISPLFCLDCFSLIPLYRLPRPEKDDFFAIYIWQKDYIACDSLQMHCETGERFGLRQMTEADSSLNRRGLQIRDEIADSTGKPVYYYLYRHYGATLTKERTRKCPNCGGDWLLDERLHELFDFCCPRCRLLSNIAYSLR